MARNVRIVTGPRPTGEIERAQAMADALSARAMRSRNPDQPWKVATTMSPWEGIAQLGEAFIAGKAQRYARQLAEAKAAQQGAANEGMIRALAGREPDIHTTPGGQKIDLPAPTSPETGRPMLMGDKAQRLAAAVAGLDPEQAGQTLGGLILQRELAEPKIERVDVGGEIVVLKDGVEVGRMPKSATPDATLRETGANARHLTPSGSAELGARVSMRGQDIGASTARRGQDITMRGQDLTYAAALRGHEATAGRYADEQAKLAEKEQARRESLSIKAEGVIGEIDKALGLVSPRTAGFGGAATRNLAPFEGAGTDARTLAATIETIQANLGFDALQEMRQNSPTGGALGQVAVQELVALRATVANLDPNLPDDVLRANLEKVKRHYGRWLMTTQGQMPPMDDGAPADPTVGTFGLPPSDEALVGQYLNPQGR